MKPEELTTFKGLVENNLMDSFENESNYQNTASNVGLVKDFFNLF
jgi:hypothetical protein